MLTFLRERRVEKIFCLLFIFFILAGYLLSYKAVGLPGLDIVSGCGIVNSGIISNRIRTTVY